MTNDYRFSHPASPDDVHGTSYILNDAAQGKPTTLRRQRADGIRAQQGVQPIPRPVLPLQLNDAAAFVDEYRRDYAPHQHVLARAVVGGVLGAALVRAVQRSHR